jgi:uncharacterized protein YbjT (DUF2867 family)
MAGAEVVRLLRPQDVGLRAAARNPAALRGTGVPGVDFDLRQPATFAPALRGIESVFLATPPAPDLAAAVAEFVDEAARAGVEHVVSLTELAVGLDGGLGMSPVERHIAASPLDWTFLRAVPYMQSFTRGVIGEIIRRTGHLCLPAGDARVAYIDARDVAAVAVAALMDPGHRAQEYVLTGAHAVDHAAIAAVLSRVAGRDILYVPTTYEALRDTLRGAGWSEPRIEAVVERFARMRAGHTALVSSTAANLLHRLPVTFERFARDHADAWAAAPPRQAPLPETRPLAAA